MALASHEQPIADAGATWDADSYLLATPTGVVELDTGSLREGTQADRLTMVTAAPAIRGALSAIRAVHARNHR